MAAERAYSIGELAAAGGVSRRTVRFYVQRGVLAPPLGLGRGARYGQAHLERLLEIRASHERGVALHDMSAGAPTPVAPATPGRPPAPRPAPAAPAAPVECDTWWAAWDESPSGEIAAALRYVPGGTWLRQPLPLGYELHVPANRSPLSTRQLGELALRLFELLQEEKGQ